MADDQNSPAARQQAMKRVYWRNAPEDHPGYVDMYAIDAANAVQKHREDYSYEPFGDEPAPLSAGVRIPVDWRDLSNARLRALAMELGAPSSVRASEAEDFIAKEEARRAEVQEVHAEAEAERDAARNRKGPAEPVAIPDDWRDQTVPQRRALARKLGAPNNVTADQANAAIEAEVARRSGNVADPNARRSSDQK